MSSVLSAPSQAALPLEGKPRYMPYGDPIRVLGTIAVVLGHVCDMPMQHEDPAGLNWWMCNIGNSVARWAVPVYIMLSGALLLDPTRSESPGTSTPSQKLIVAKRTASPSLRTRSSSAFFGASPCT